MILNNTIYSKNIVNKFNLRNQSGYYIKNHLLIMSIL